MTRFFIVALMAVVAFLGAEVRLVEQENFQKEIASGTVLVDFYGPWCGPCKRIAPVLDQLSQEMEGKVSFIKVNIDKAQDLTNKYEVTGVPAIVLFKNGKEQGRVVGFHDKSSLRKFIESGGKG